MNTRPRPLRPLPRHLLPVLSLIPTDGAYIDERDLTEKACARPGGTRLNGQGRIDGIRHLRRHGFTIEQRLSEDSPVLYTRTPKGTNALGHALRKGPRS